MSQGFDVILFSLIKVETIFQQLKNVSVKTACSLQVIFVRACVSLQGYEVRKITAIDQDLGRPRGIGYTIITGLSHIIDLTSAAQRGESITSYHNSAVIIDKSHQAQQSITAERSSSELENRLGSEHLLITVLVQLCRSQLSFCVIILKLACAIKTGL